MSTTRLARQTILTALGWCLVSSGEGTAQGRRGAGRVEIGGTIGLATIAAGGLAVEGRCGVPTGALQQGPPVAA